MKIFRETQFRAGLTLPEIIVVLCIFIVLAVLAMPQITAGPVRSVATQTLSNMKQLHLATQQMALDGLKSTNAKLGWPGDTGGRFEIWASNLVEGGYLSTNDLDKLLSGPGRLTPPGTVPRFNTNAILAYTVGENSDSSTVFLTSANFTNTPVGGVAPLSGALPYGARGFVVFRKAGDGAILQSRQAGNTNIVGTYVPLCR